MDDNKTGKNMGTLREIIERKMGEWLEKIEQEKEITKNKELKHEEWKFSSCYWVL